MRTQSEYDCLEEQARILALTVFAGNMGQGGVVPSIPFKKKREWEPVAPASMSQSLWKVACGKQ